jgi:hypothetical protein
MAWVDQRRSDFGKSRSLAIRAAMTVLEERGFTLPEPIYRLRFDAQQFLPASIADQLPQPAADADSATKPVPGPAETIDANMDVSPDKHLEEKVNLERAMNSETDLLDRGRPAE